MIGLEFMLFQLVMQWGRWQLFRFGTLTGTNFVLRRKVLEEVNGWDVYALAEDAELTARTPTILLTMLPFITKPSLHF